MKKQPKKPVSIRTETRAGWLEIVTAQPRDVSYCVHWLKRYSNRVGFFPRAGLERQIDSRSVWIATLNGQPAGWIMVRGGILRPITLVANCVDEELWRAGIGTATVRAALAYAARHTRWPYIRGRTREDLTDQNHINASTGALIAARHAPGTRGHAVLEWHWPSYVAPRAVPLDDDAGFWHVMLPRELKDNGEIGT